MAIIAYAAHTYHPAHTPTGIDATVVVGTLTGTGDAEAAVVTADHGT